MKPRTPLTLLTGSLGSGKTTLLKRILTIPDRRLAVLMNEFGEIAIDSRAVPARNVEMVELLGGCVCCSMTGEFEAAVREVLEKAHPELIVVEATGVAESDALAYEVEDNLPEVRLDSVVCVVDAYLSVRHPSVGYTARTQYEKADIVLINKIDLVTTDEVRTVEAQVRAYNNAAILFKTVGCDLDPRLLFGMDVERRPITVSPHGETEFQSFPFVTDRPMDEERFHRVLAGLPSSVYRAKGFLRGVLGGRLVNYVVGRVDMEDFAADRTEMVFIGRHLAGDREDILKRLRDCEV